MGTIIQVQDINTKAEYSYEEGSDFFIDENHKLIHIVTSGYDENEHPNDMCIEIQGSTPDFTETYRVLYSLSFDDVRSLDMHRQALEMESDLDYMKSHGEHGSDCSDCDYNHYDVNVEPCASCVDYCNHSKSNILPTDERATEIQDNVRYEDKHTMNAICGPLKEQFGNPKTEEEIFKLSVGQLYSFVYPDHTGDQIHDFFVKHNLNCSITTTQRIEKAKEELYNIWNVRKVQLKPRSKGPSEELQKCMLTDPEELRKTLDKLGFTQKYIDNFKKCLDNHTTPALEEIKLQEQIKEHIKFIIDYLWDIEMKNFSETFEVSIQSQDDLQQWIDWCENYIMTHDNLEIGEDPINHIFYHLMKLKKLYNL